MTCPPIAEADAAARAARATAATDLWCLRGGAPQRIEVRSPTSQSMPQSPARMRYGTHRRRAARRRF